MSSYFEDRIENDEDKELFASLSETEAAHFSAWLERLDKHHAEIGAPYGDGSLIGLTGVWAWFFYFEDGYGPSDALDEYLSDPY